LNFSAPFVSVSAASGLPGRDTKIQQKQPKIREKGKKGKPIFLA